MIEKEKILEELKAKNIKFKVDVLDQIRFNNLLNSSESLRIALNTNLTSKFNSYIEDKLKAKEQVKLNIKGETRSGKSLVGLKLIHKITTNYKDKNFDSVKQVCANQRELLQKLNEVIFGDSFLIDENAFTNVGSGSMTQLQQLKDINNIVAKENIHLISITPQVFMNTGATYGLEYYGRDSKNWLSRFLLLSLKNNMPELIGYVIFDIGKLFQETGCLIYNLTGGCTNPNKLKYEDLPKDYIKYSSCISKDFSLDELQKEKNCPFYNVCSSQLCKYEHKKDKWIQRELKGGLREREIEKYDLGLSLFLEFAYIEEEKISLTSNKRNDLKTRVKLKLPMMTNTQFTGVEIEEITSIIYTLTDLKFLKQVCESLEKDYSEIYSQIEKR